MIEIVEGTVGGGKTLYAVRETCERLSRGQFVYTNVDMQRGPLRRYLLDRYGVYLRSEQLVQLPEAESVMDYWVGKNRVKGTVYVMGKTGRHIRFNALSPTGGTPMVDGCSACVSAVCAQDDWCCTEEWDSLCVDIAAGISTCGC